MGLLPGLTLVLSSVRLIAEGSDGFNISFNPTCGSACRCCFMNFSVSASTNGSHLLVVTIPILSASQET